MGFASEALASDPEFARAVAWQLEHQKPPRVSAHALSDANAEEHGTGKKAPIAPPALVETTFILKAATTQLISVAGLVFVLLPFYDFGFDWWLVGFSNFLGISFDRPKLALDFNVTFGWPKFTQPRLAWQLGFGVILVVKNVAFGGLKYLLRATGSLLRMKSPVPSRNEARMVKLLAAVTWELFGTVMGSTKVAFESSVTRIERAWKASHGQALKDRAVEVGLLVLGTVGCCIPVFSALKESRIKVFSPSAGDSEVSAFAGREDSLAYRHIRLSESETVTRVSLQILCQRCIWLTHTEMSDCPSLKGSLDDVAGLSLVEVNLARTPVSGDLAALQEMNAFRKVVILRHTSVRGSLDHLAGCVHLIDLDLSFTSVTGDLQVLKGCAALRRLKVDSTGIGGRLEDLAGLGHLANLDVGASAVTGRAEPLLEACLLLRRLNLHGLKLEGSYAEVKRLAEALPHLAEANFAGATVGGVPADRLSAENANKGPGGKKGKKKGGWRKKFLRFFKK
jgi:hypothetical protein